MPPIKRTKFKLTPEQLLDMFHWLKLIRAFDERLSILVRQGKVLMMLQAIISLTVLAILAARAVNIL